MTQEQSLIDAYSGQVISVSAAHIMVPAERFVIAEEGGSPYTIYLPLVANIGIVYTIWHGGTSGTDVTVSVRTADSGANIIKDTGAATTFVLSYYGDFIIVLSDGTNWIKLGG